MEHDNYKGLFEKLNEIKFPTWYMFKFIVLNDISLLNEAKDLATNPDLVESKLSKNGKYISLTFTEKKETPEEIIEVYKKAEKIDSIVAL